MRHVLDNPAWTALLSGNKELAKGTDTAKYFDSAVCPFVAIADHTPENFDLLRQIVPSDNPVVLIAAEKITVANSWNVLQRVDGWQMLYNHIIEPLDDAPVIRSLTEQHVPQMLALTKLTNPGPFLPRTIDFGHYEGIFDDNQLIAMAGQRLHAHEFAEISAVCTHPDYLGKGYARQLMLHQIQRIQAQSGVPFLHVRADNGRAAGIYQAMGFEPRTEVYFYILQKQ